MLSTERQRGGVLPLGLSPSWGRGRRRRYEVPCCHIQIPPSRCFLLPLPLKRGPGPSATDFRILKLRRKWGQKGQLRAWNRPPPLGRAFLLHPPTRMRRQGQGWRMGYFCWIIKKKPKNSLLTWRVQFMNFKHRALMDFYI